MKKYLMGVLVSLVLIGCVPMQYKIDKDLESNSHIQVIVNDFIGFLRTKYKRGKWIKIEGGDGNVYISKLRATSIRKGLKVCINKCPNNAITFETLIERIDGNLLEATISTPTYTFHRIYKLDRKNNIKRFGNPTIYKR